MNAKGIAVMVTLAVSGVARADANAMGPNVRGTALDARGDLASMGILPGSMAEDLATGASGEAGASAIFIDALYGGLAGVLIGAGVALIDGGNWGRDLGIGAGAGIIVGAALGAVRQLSDVGPNRLAMDGMGSTARDPVMSARTVGVGGRF